MKVLHDFLKILQKLQNLGGNCDIKKEAQPFQIAPFDGFEESRSMKLILTVLTN